MPKHELCEILHPRAEEPINRGAANAVEVPESLAAQLIAAGLVHLACEQSILGLAEMHEAIEIDFVQHHIVTLIIQAQVNDAALVVFYLGDPERLTFRVVDAVTHRINYPPQRGVIHGVDTLFRGGGKSNFNTAISHASHDTQTQLGLGVTYPTLSGGKFNRRQEK